MKENKLLIPLIIIIIGLAIVIIVFFVSKEKNNINQEQKDEIKKTNEIAKIPIEPVLEEEHILGNPEAEVMIFTYSDYQCTFCVKFHKTMERIIAEYIEDGKVAWIFRHFPIDSSHSKARLAAEASECVFEQKGNLGFWKYSEKLFENSPDSLSEENLLANAILLEINEEMFKECLESKRYSEKVQNNYQQGLKAAEADSRFGTPYSIVVKKDGNQMIIRGAQPYELIKEIIDIMLK
jgi:protein-disulfide isomerase